MFFKKKGGGINDKNDKKISPLKYVMSDFLSGFEYLIEKMFGLWKRVWISILNGPNSCQEA